MTHDELIQEWTTDSKFTPDVNLKDEQIRVCNLHSKYFKWYMEEKRLLIKLEAFYRKEFKQAYVGYTQGISPEEWKALRAEGKEVDQYPKVLKRDKYELETYLNSDPKLTILKTKLDLQKQLVDGLDAILKVINNRGFAIKNAIEWHKIEKGLV